MTLAPLSFGEGLGVRISLWKDYRAASIHGINGSFFK